VWRQTFGGGDDRACVRLATERLIGPWALAFALRDANPPTPPFGIRQAPKLVLPSQHN